MTKINENFLKLKTSYLFKDIADRILAYEERHPGQPVVRLGIGDVTEPLPKACRDAFHKAVDEMGDRSTFRGYDDTPGYSFIREAIVENDFKLHDAPISSDEIFLSDGAKCDTGNIQEIFSLETRIAIPDPVYPVYIDSNVMAGRSGINENGKYRGITYLESTPQNDYIPEVPDFKVDLIYLCFPNNPTGATATREQLEMWVQYALRNQSIILFDAAYEAFIADKSLPHSIYEIDGARKVAIEFRSYSKNAGFTGVRCAFTVVPKDLFAIDAKGKEQSLHALWSRRYATKFNGVSYPVQRAAEAVYSQDGKQQVRELVNYYMANARLIGKAMGDAGFSCVGGENSPYVWINVGGDSWEFFDRLLNEAGVVCTPGAGFGFCGEGHIRISAFNSRENVEEGLRRIRGIL